MSLIRETKEIDQFMKNTDWSLLLYAMFFGQINNAHDRGKSVIVFQFSSPAHLLTWLKDGVSTSNMKVMLLTYEMALKVATKQHQKCIRDAKIANAIALCFTSLTESKEIWSSVLALMKVDDIEDLQSIVDNHPVHAKSLVVLP